MSDTTQPAGESKLLPCPFCGEQPQHDFFDQSQYPHEIYCDNCIGTIATQQKTFDAAVAAWNRRAADRTILGKERIRNPDDVCRCSCAPCAYCDCKLEA